MFRTLIYQQDLATILWNYHIGRKILVRCVLEFRCGWVGKVSVLQAEIVLQSATRIPLQPNHTETPTHKEPRTYDQCGNSTE